jgi:hypothetical protein
MRTVRQLGAVIIVAAFLDGAALAQTVSPTNADSSSGKKWSYTLSASGYLVPHDLSYGSPTFAADHEWLHLEARYNYEAQKTGSLWAGYNFSAGHNLVLDVTPIFGVVFGEMTGVSPGYEMSLNYKKVDLSSEGEYVFDTGHSNQSFFYSWNELTYSPVEWCHFGLASQRTRAYQTELDVQRGVSLGFAYKKIDYTTYIFNAGWTDPTLVLAFTYKF